ncbi:MAG TPA: NAD(P)-binding domain-containing protein [Actinomycetota bacterium]|nr:NAD(P)-binding domain-containing protein [Actinomycetota bacterium]
MAKLNGKPFPPGDYPVVIVGSGPGGLQAAYSLSRLGVDHAIISEDEQPGGMFRRFPLFQRLITWTKPHAPAERGTRPYEWYDWNSLLAEEPEQRALVPRFMDGTSYFPSRDEMERGLVAFVEGSDVRVRYGCRWESTRRDGDDRFVLSTSDGDYRCATLVVAVGMTEPWKPQIPGLDEVPHYVETKPVREYAGKRVLVIGKRNSGFEVADGLLPWASQIVLASPRPARISVLVHSTAAARARYLQPFEDHVLGGGNVVLDAATERIERTPNGYRAFLHGTTKPGDLVIDADDVIAATGFSTPLRDLPQLGVATFYQGRLPAQTPWWESTSTPGVFFAGSITQGSIGLKKYGIPSNSAAVHGFRYNARVLARRIAETRLGVQVDRPAIAPNDVVGFLLAEATYAPELWNQQSYLAHALLFDPDRGIVDEGIIPLAYFVDDAGGDAVAIAVETDAEGDIHPAVYVRRDGRVDEHTLASSPLMKFDGQEQQRQLAAVLKGLI